MDRRTSVEDLSFPGLDQTVAEFAASQFIAVHRKESDSIRAPQTAPFSRMSHRTYTKFLEADMPFAIEPIPEEVITTGVLSNYRVYQDRQIPFSSKWVVDHDRNARMAIVSRVGGASGPSDGTHEVDGFALFWHEHVIAIWADPLPSSYPPSGPEMNWRVHRVQLPQDLQARQGEVLELIRDAFRAYNGDRFAAVNVSFDLAGSGSNGAIKE